MAPQVGLEPTTLRLTGPCSLISTGYYELLFSPEIMHLTRARDCGDICEFIPVSVEGPQSFTHSDPKKHKGF